MYKDYEIFDAHWAYGMKNVSTKTMGSSSEILIIGQWTWMKNYGKNLTMVFMAL